MEHTISFYPTELSIAFLISSSTLKTTAKTEQLMGKMFETMGKKKFFDCQVKYKEYHFFEILDRKIEILLVFFLLACYKRYMYAR